MLAAIVSLTGRPGLVHWHFFVMSIPNVVVIVLMLALFCVALLAPFPGRRAHAERNR
jgi:hypothetical protein